MRRKEDAMTNLVALVLAGLFVWMANSTAWWFAIPMAAGVVGATAAPAFWQCLLLSLVPGVGQMAFPVLACAWILGLFQ